MLSKAAERPDVVDVAAARDTAEGGCHCRRNHAGLHIHCGDALLVVSKRDVRVPPVSQYVEPVRSWSCHTPDLNLLAGSYSELHWQEALMLIITLLA